MKLISNVTIREEEEGTSLLIQSTEEGTVEALVLNSTGTSIVSLLKNSIDEKSLVSKLAEEYSITDMDILTKDVNIFISNLFERGWIINE